MSDSKGKNHFDFSFPWHEMEEELLFFVIVSTLDHQVFTLCRTIHSLELALLLFHLQTTTDSTTHILTSQTTTGYPLRSTASTRRHITAVGNVMQQVTQHQPSAEGLQ